MAKPNKARSRKPAAFIDDPLWYKDAIIYQVHVKSFFDSNNDGIGDFPGLIDKLDYIAWASTPSGCCRSILRRGATTATTSRNTAASIPTMAPWPMPSVSSPRPMPVACG